MEAFYIKKQLYINNKIFNNGELLFEFIDMDFKNIMYNQDIEIKTIIDSCCGFLNQINYIFSNLYIEEIFNLTVNNNLISITGDSDKERAISNNLDYLNLLDYDNKIIAHQKITNTFKSLAIFQNQVKEDILYCLDVDSSPKKLNELKPIQRRYLYQMEFKDKEITSISDSIKTTTRLEIEKENKFVLNTSIDDRINEIKKYIPVKQTIFDVKSIKDLIVIEFNHLVENNIPIRICKRCKKYFIPFSKDSLYCKRIDKATNKNCQKIGALESFYNKTDDDEINKIIENTYKRLRQKVSRAVRTKLMYRTENWHKKVDNINKKIVLFNNRELLKDEFIQWLNDDNLYL